MCVRVCVSEYKNKSLCSGVRVREFTCACVCVRVCACARESECVIDGMRENESGDSCV